MYSEKLLVDEESIEKLYESIDSRIFSVSRPTPTNRSSIKNPEKSQNLNQSIKSRMQPSQNQIFSYNPENDSNIPSRTSEKNSKPNLNPKEIMHNTRQITNINFLNKGKLPENSLKVVNFIKTFFHHCSKNITQDTETKLSLNISGLSQAELSEISGTFCTFCFRLLIPIKLDCGDLFCSICMSDLINSFISSPSLSTFKALSCRVCHLNISISIIKNILKDLSEQFMNIQLNVTCESCNFSHSIKNYWTESPCFHLCGNCYSESLYFNQNYCRFCNARFGFTHSSKNRVSTCENCGFVGFSVSSGFRCLEKTLCFRCFQNFSLQAQKERRRVMGFYLNKSCSACNQITNIADLTVKECCEYYVCETCFNSKGCVCTRIH